MPLNLLKTKAIAPTHALCGADMENRPFGVELATGPHWIIAGQSGSGKSVYMNGLLCSVMYHSTPDEVEIYAIDPKKVEFTPYAGLPFCPVDPITVMEDAFGLLKYLTWLMDERYEQYESLAAHGYIIKQLKEYNAWIDENPELAEALGHTPHKFIIVVIDEYADMQMQVPEAEAEIVRLAQKARAAGITLLIATQRPSAEIISPVIKSNVPARIGLKTTDVTNSTIVIDEGGLEKLRGYGDSIVMMTDGSKTRVQGPYIANNEMEEAFAQMLDRYGPPTRFDYKTKCVDLGLMEWAGEYDETTPEKDKHIVKKSRRPGGRR